MTDPSVSAYLDNAMFAICQPAHWIRVPLSLLLLQDLLISESYNMRFEVFTGAEIHIVVHPENGGSMWYPPNKLHGVITRKSTLLG
jgi:hypothetical protein